MSDVTPRELVLAAMAAAGPVGGDEIAWRLKVARLIPVVNAQLDEKSYLGRRATLILESTMFAAEVESITIEESSQRMLVAIKGDEAPLRSERLETPQGKWMQERLRKVTPGDRVLLWRFNEPLASDPKKKTRVLTHIEVLPRRRDENATADRRSAPPADRAVREPGPAGESPTTGRAESFPERNESILDSQGLSSRQLARVAARCRAEGIDDFVHPAIEHLDRVLVICAEERTNP